MDDKKADNRLFIDKQDDNLIDNKRKELNEIDNISDKFISLSKRIDKCIDLLNLSMKSTNNNRKLENLRRENIENLSNVLETIENYKLEVEEKYRKKEEKD